MGGIVFPQAKIKVVFLGAGLKQADVGLGDFNIGQRGTVPFELPQALLAVGKSGLALFPGFQILLHGRLQHLAGELAGLDC